MCLYNHIFPSLMTANYCRPYTKKIFELNRFLGSKKGIHCIVTSSWSWQLPAIQKLSASEQVNTKVLSHEMTEKELQTS